jgi:hypothetical protein
MQHISALHVQQFRGLREVSLQELGRVNLLVGGNNAGKSSVLEAVATFCRPLDPWAWFRAARGRATHGADVPLLEALKWLFPQSAPGASASAHQDEDGLYAGKIMLCGEGAFAVRQVAASLHEFRAEPADADAVADADGLMMPLRGADLQVQALVESSQQQDDFFPFNAHAREVSFAETFQVCAGERFVQRTLSTCPRLAVRQVGAQTHWFEQLLQQRTSEVARRELLGLAVALLQLFDPAVEGVEVWAQDAGQPQLYVRHHAAGLAPLYTFGAGLQRVLLLAMTLLLCKDGVLLIDALETALHTRSLEQTFNWLMQACDQYNVQLFATTHSLETLDELLGASERSGVELVLYRLEGNVPQVVVKRFAQRLLSRVRGEAGAEVRW